MPEEELEWSLEDYIKKYGPPPQKYGYTAVRWGGNGGGWFLAWSCTVGKKPCACPNCTNRPQDW